MPKVSVILACYNGARWIDETIESIIDQTFDDFELIIIDDGSTDNSRDVISSYLPDERIQYIFQENKGFSAANNTGIRASKGDLVGFIGDDDLWMPTKLERQVNYLNAHSDVSVVHSDLYHINPKGVITQRRRPKVPETVSSKDTTKELFFRNFICFQTALLKRTCFETVGLFDERMVGFSDHDLWLRVAGKFKIGYIEQPLVKKRYHQNTLTKTRREDIIEDQFLMAHKVVKRYPFLEELKQEKWAELYYKWGMILLQKGKYKKARKRFISAMKCNLASLKSTIASLAPSIYLAAWRRYFRIRRQFKEHGHPTDKLRNTPK